MKKLITLLIVLSLSLSIVSCAKKEDSSTNTKTETDTSTNETTESGDTTADAQENTTVKETWTKDFYVDDFNEPTDEWFISSSFTGTFSNSATNNSNLSGYILIDQTYVSFILYEYNRNQVKNIYSHEEEYTIVTRDVNGNEQQFTGYIYSEGDRVIVSDAQTSAMKELLKNGEKIKFYIYETDNSVTNYLFQTESTNLSSLLA